MITSALVVIISRTVATCAVKREELPWVCAQKATSSEGSSDVAFNIVFHDLPADLLDPFVPVFQQQFNGCAELAVILRAQGLALEYSSQQVETAHQKTVQVIIFLNSIKYVLHETIVDDLRH